MGPWQMLPSSGQAVKSSPHCSIWKQTGDFFMRLQRLLWLSKLGRPGFVFLRLGKPISMWQNMKMCTSLYLCVISKQLKQHSSCSCLYEIMVIFLFHFTYLFCGTNYDSTIYNFYLFCRRVLTQASLFGRSFCALLHPKKIMKLFSWCALWEQQLTMRDFSIEKALAIASTSGVE